MIFRSYRMMTSPYGNRCRGRGGSRSGDFPVADFVARSAILSIHHPGEVRRFARMRTATGMSPLLAQAPTAKLHRVIHIFGIRLRICLIALFCFASVSAFAAIKQEPIPELLPPRDELPTRSNPRDVLPWYIAGGVATVIAVLALTWPREKRPVISEPAYVRASRELASATTAEAISNSVRDYALAVFPLPGRGQTPEELLAFLAKHPRCTPELSTQLAQFFAPVEVAKFAPLAPAPTMDELRTQAAQILAALETLRIST